MNDLFSVQGKVAVVSGGSRGIGAMIARGFVENGVKTYITARNEEALLVAQQRAANGSVGELFFFLNASDQSGLLIEYLQDHWPDLSAFQQDVPPDYRGYSEMVNIAQAYRRAGNQDRFEEAMAIIDAAMQQSQSQGVLCQRFLVTQASYHVMKGEHDQALSLLSEAIDRGLITSTKISSELPFFQELDGNPEYEAMQARMIEHLNLERQKLGLEPVSA